MQIIRTYPVKRPDYPFAPEGERSIGRAYRKALRRARRLVYVEDQYLWSEAWADAMASALRGRSLALRLIAVIRTLRRARRPDLCERREHRAASCARNSAQRRRRPRRDL